MGFLYPYRVVKGKEVPSRADFIEARQELMQKLKDHAGGPEAVVLFGGIYGSVIPKREDHTERSDIDVLVVYPDGKVEEAHTLNARLRDIGHKHHVVVSARKVSVSQARKGRHPYGPTFRLSWWKSLSEQGMLVGDPQKLFKLLHVDPSRTVRSDMRYRIAKLLKLLKRQQTRFEELLRDNPRDPDPACEYGMDRNVRPLHLYLSVARWMLWWQNGRLDDDSKAAVLKAVKEVESFRKLRLFLDDLRRIDRSYDELLKRTLAEQETAEAYRKQVYDIITRTFIRNIMLLEAALETMDAGTKPVVSRRGKGLAANV